MASISFVLVVQFVSRSFVLMIDLRFLIGFTSGEFPGQFNTDSLFFLKNFRTILDMWQEEGAVERSQNHRKTFFHL